METNNRNIFKSVLWFAAGGVVGAVTTLLYAPKSGKEFRMGVKKDINSTLNKAKLADDKLIKNAKDTSDEIVVKADQIMSLAKNFASGNYEGPFEKLKGEINGLKAGINAAMRRYHHSDLARKSTSEIFEQDLRDLEAMMEFDYEKDEALPKHEGMSRRN